MLQDYLPQPSTATPSMSADESWAEWKADWIKPSRQRKVPMTPSQRKERADLLRWWRDQTLDVELTGQRESTRKRSER